MVRVGIAFLQLWVSTSPLAVTPFSEHAQKAAPGLQIEDCPGKDNIHQRMIIAISVLGQIVKLLENLSLLGSR